MKPSDIEYTVDRNLRILAVNESWDKFAEENGADCYSNKVVGKKLTDFFANQQIQDLYRMMIQNVYDSQKGQALQFRCDSHEVLRFMKMNIRPNEKGNVVVSTKMVREVQRKRVLSSEILYLGLNAGIPMCSCCNKIFLKKKRKWMEIDDALDLNLINEVLNVSFDLCDNCKIILKQKTSN